MHVGIDLGTSNSALALFDGVELRMVPNALGETLTPSVVRFDPRGGLLVGRRAWRFLETDPANTRSEFKRLMGTAERLSFEGSGREALPEELAAEVLRSLLADAAGVLGYAPEAAVVSTPALFELPQSHATARAAKLAGLREVALIQEPIASAVAAGWNADSEEQRGGLWLVYDLGGGTLDVSLLESRDASLRVVDHDGDNFLGGRDVDLALTEWAAARLAAETGTPPLRRSEPKHRRPLAKLKAACEQAKIDLSRREQTSIFCSELRLDEGSDPIDVDLPVTRTEVEALAAPLLERSLKVCRRLLERQHVAPDDVERVVFVGGPTLMPAVRERVGTLFGGRIAEGVDPMTAVARGAALYAATLGLAARPPRPSATATGMVVRVEHPAVTGDLRPFVVGRFFAAAAETLPARVRIERSGAGMVREVPVAEQGTFVVDVELLAHQQNRFRLTAFDTNGDEVPLRTPDFAIVHGLSVAEPPLARSIGVARADDRVQVYFAKGTPLPARRTFGHQTVQRVAAGSAEDALGIPLVQGELSRAHLNRLIGRLEIAGRGLQRDLPAGTRVEVTLELDRSGQLQARADLPESGLSFADVVHVLVPSASPEVLEAELAATEQRVASAQRRGFATSAPALLRTLSGAAAVLAEARAGIEAARGGDADAAARVHRLLLDLAGSLEEAEGQLAWPQLEAEANDEIERALSWIGGLGTAGEHELAERALQGAAEARERRDVEALDRHVRTLRTLAAAAFHRDPRSAHTELEWYAAHLTEATDVARAAALLAEGRELSARGDERALRQLNLELDLLFPGTPEERRRSYGSGIR